MIVEPRRGVPASLLDEKLRYVHNSTFNVFNGNSDVQAVTEQYLRWVAESEQMLRPVMSLSDLDRVLLTRRYWATQANPSYSRGNVRAVQEEVRTRQQVFDELVTAVDLERRRWTSAEPEAVYVVADTNVHLHHPTEWAAIDWRAVVGWQNRTMAAVQLVVPMLVVDELDNGKRSSKQSTGTRARSTIRTIYRAFATDTFSTWQMRPPTSDSGATRVTLLMDAPTHHRLDRADDELVDRALLLSGFVDHPVYFVTYDGGAALRARRAGLEARHLVHGEDGN
jgi:hypothetical protein